MVNRLIGAVLLIGIGLMVLFHVWNGGGLVLATSSQHFGRSFFCILDSVP